MACELPPSELLSMHRVFSVLNCACELRVQDRRQGTSAVPAVVVISSTPSVPFVMVVAMVVYLVG